LFRERQRLGVLLLRYKHVDHAEPRREPVLEKTLLLLFAACDFTTQRFDALDRSEKTVARFRGPSEADERTSDVVLRGPDLFAAVNVVCEFRRALAHLQHRRILALRFVQSSEIVERKSHGAAIFTRLTQAQTFH